MAVIAVGSPQRREQDRLNPGLGQVTADGRQRDRRIVGRLMGRVEIWVSGVVQSDKFQLRVQARGPRRAGLGIDLMAQSGRVRVQADRRAKGQLERCPLGVLQKEQRMVRLKPISADPVHPSPLRRVHEAIGATGGLLTRVVPTALKFPDL